MASAGGKLFSGVTHLVSLERAAPPLSFWYFSIFFSMSWVPAVNQCFPDFTVKHVTQSFPLCVASPPGLNYLQLCPPSKAKEMHLRSKCEDEILIPTLNSTLQSFKKNTQIQILLVFVPLCVNGETLSKAVMLVETQLCHLRVSDACFYNQRDFFHVFSPRLNQSKASLGANESKKKLDSSHLYFLLF